MKMYDLYHGTRGYSIHLWYLFINIPVFIDILCNYILLLLL